MLPSKCVDLQLGSLTGIRTEKVEMLREIMDRERGEGDEMHETMAMLSKRREKLRPKDAQYCTWHAFTRQFILFNKLHDT